MSQRKGRFSPPTSPNYGGFTVLTCAPRPGDPNPSEMVDTIPARPLFELAPNDDEQTAARKKAALAAAVVGLIAELSPNTHRQTVEEAAREFVDRLARAPQPATTCHTPTSKNSVATPSIEGTSP